MLLPRPIGRILALGAVVLIMVGLLAFVNKAPVSNDPAPFVSIIGGGTASGERLNNSGNSYVPMLTSGTNLGSEALAQQSMPIDGKVSNLYVRLHIPPGASKKFTFVVRKNGASGALTCEISGSVDTTCSDLTNTLTFVVGNLISMEATAVGIPNRADMRWTAKFAAEP